MFTPSANLCPFDAQNGAQIIADLRAEGSFIVGLMDLIPDAAQKPSTPVQPETVIVWEDFLPILMDALQKAPGIANGVLFTAFAFFLSQVKEVGEDEVLKLVEGYMCTLANITEGVLLDRIK